MALARVCSIQMVQDFPSFLYVELEALFKSRADTLGDADARRHLVGGDGDGESARIGYDPHSECA